MRDGLLDVLVITGGHPFQADPFFSMFDADPGVQWMQARQPRAQQFFNPRVADLWDAFVMFDLPGFEPRDGRAPLAEAPPAQMMDGFDALCDEGHGFVFLHHALGAWPRWPVFGDALGGRLLLEPGLFGGQVWPPSGYRSDTWHKLDVVDTEHPLTAGLGDGFELTDELYLMPVDEQRITPLLRSDFRFVDQYFSSAELRARGRSGRSDGWRHPPGAGVMAWTSRYRNTELVCIQSGGSPETHANPSFRRLLANALRWVSRERPGGPALAYEPGPPT